MTAKGQIERLFLSTCGQSQKDLCETLGQALDDLITEPGLVKTLSIAEHRLDVDQMGLIINDRIVNYPRAPLVIMLWSLWSHRIAGGAGLPLGEAGLLHWPVHC